MQSTSTYISEQVRDSDNNLINPATEEGLNAIIDAVDSISLTELPLRQWDEGELITRDIGLDRVLWSDRIVDEWALKTKMISGDVQWITKKLTWLNGESKIFTKGFSTLSVQISGTWVGTIVFEATSDVGNFVSIAGLVALSNTLAYNTTVNGIYRFNVAGLHSIKIRMSAYTSGVATVNFNLSANTLWQSFAQSAAGAMTINGAVTEAILDTNLPFIAPSQMYQTGMELEWVRVVEPTVAPAQPATYAAPKFAQYPQKFRRLRVEVGWSERLPLAQEPNTNRLVVATPEVYRILEEISLALYDIRDILKISNGVDTSQR